MVSLRELQQNFTRAILENRPEDIAGDILPHNLTAKDCYQIYQNNTFITLGQALNQNFPVLCRLVGQKFFDQMTKDYVKIYPPKNPLLMTYGDRMPDFLDNYYPVIHLPYLADVSRLENYWNESFNGPDSKEFDNDRLNDVTPEKFSEIQFNFIPNMGLMSSEYPVLDIWIANQDTDNGQKEIPLDQGGCHICIFRKYHTVEILSLDQNSFLLLEKLHSGVILGDVVTEMMSKHPDFDLQRSLQVILQNGLIEDFNV